MKIIRGNRKGVLLTVFIASALLVVLGCSSSRDPYSATSPSDQGVEMTGDQLGPPGHIESRPQGTDNPSSVTGGGGGASGAGSNTNMNTPPAEPPQPTYSVAETTDTPSVQPTPVIAQVEPRPAPPTVAPTVAPPPPPLAPAPIHEVTKKE